MVFAIYRAEDQSWVVAHDGKSISKHSTFDEAKKIASLLSVDLCGKVEVVDSDTYFDEFEQKLILTVPPTALYQ